MNQTARRLFAMVLAVCLLLNCIPLQIFAKEDGSASEETGELLGSSGNQAVLEETETLPVSQMEKVASENTAAPAEKTSVPENTEAAVEDAISVVLDSGEVTFTFDSTTGTINGCDPGSATEIVIPESIDSVTVQTIGYNAFAGLADVTAITIPSTVTEIQDKAFDGCTGLTSITIPGSVKTVGHRAFNCCTGLVSAVVEEGVEELNSHCFWGCTSLKSISFPSTLTLLGGFSFASEENTYVPLKTLDLSQTAVKKIPQGICYACAELETVKLPETVTEIDVNAFRECGNLVSINIPDSVQSIGNSAFFECEKLAQIHIPDGVSVLEQYTFFKCISLTELSIPDSVQTIGDYAVRFCTGLTTIEIPDSVTTIGAGAFQDNTGLTSIVIPDSVTSLGEYAFFNCPAVTTVTIGDGVESIGEYAFYACESVQTLTIGGKVKTIGDYAFGGCYKSLSQISIPNSVESIGASAFWNCCRLTGIAIPASVGSIGDKAFERCYDLESVWILNKDMTFGASLFQDASASFVIYGYSGSTAQTYAEQNNHRFQSVDSRTLSVRLMTPEETELTEGFTVAWFAGSDSLVCDTAIFENADESETYTYEITLGDELAARYAQPETGTVTPEDSGECVIVLEAIPPLVLSGRVADQNGSGISGASVTVVETDTGEQTQLRTGANGSFQVEVPRVTVSVAIREDSYYSQKTTVYLNSESGDAWDLGTLTMVPTVSDRIALNITLVPAAEDPDTAVGTVLATAENLNVTVAREDGSAITGFELQGMNLIFEPNVVSAAETLTVTVSDPREEYLPSRPVRVTLDSSKMGIAEISLTQKGRLVLGAVTGCEAFANLFNAQGQNIWMVPAQAQQTSAPLDAGSYTLVLIQNTSLLRGVSELSVLSTLGLTAGTDYLQMQVTIADGTILRLEECVVPKLNESKLSYTVPEHTSVSISKPGGLASGELFMLRLEYELDPTKSASAVSLQAVLPVGIEPSGDRIALLDNTPAAYTFDSGTRTVTVDVSGKTSAVAYLYCQAGSAAGAYCLNGCLTLSSGAVQPVGTTIATVEKASLRVPEKTSQASIAASGKTAPNATVTLYDNGTQVARTSANSAGSWSTSLTLSGEMYNNTYHYIHAEISSGSFAEPVMTEQLLVIYREETIELKRITMYNNNDYGAGKTVLDFTSLSTQEMPYLYNPYMPTITFQAEFSGSAELAEVYIVTLDECGHKTYVELTYDASLDAWVGSHDYSMEPPAYVGVAYTPETVMAVDIDEALFTDLADAYVECGQAVCGMLQSAFDEYFEQTYDEASQISTLTYVDPDTDMEREFVCVRFEETALPEGTDGESLTEQGYLSIDEEGTIWMAYFASGNTVTMSIADLTTGEVVNQVMDFSASLGEKAAVLFSDSIPTVTVPGLGWNDAITVILNAMGECPIAPVKVAGIISGLGLNVANGVAEMKIAETLIQGHCDVINAEIDMLIAMLDATCKDGTRKLTGSVFNEACDKILALIKLRSAYFQEGQNWKNALLAYQAEALAFSLLSGKLLEQAMPANNLLLKVMKVGTGSAIDIALNKGGAMTADGLRIWANTEYNSIMEQIEECKQYILAYYSKCDPNPKEEIEPIPTPIEWDPSGYVYEAVPSNRLENVTAVVYYQGDDGSDVQWNAGAYDQVNPQITGPDGGYRWDVVKGQWKVKFTKEGYEPADTTQVQQAGESGWLPVPPPQLDINVGMVSTAAPAVRFAAAYTEQAELVFSQYMDIASVRNAVTLTRNGAAVSVTVQALNAEYDLEEENQYATRFAVIPADNDLSGSIVVSVSAAAKNYAGTALTSAYTSDALTAQEKPTELNGPDAVRVGTGKEVTLALTLQPCVSGKTLTVENVTPSLVSVLTAEVVTDENGRAVITVRGNLPGAGRITVTEPVSGLSKTIAIDTQKPADDSTVQPVVAELEDGTPVTNGMALPAGTRVVLTTGTQNAAIRYTLNDTCPCKEAALTYSEPIVISGDTVLRAAACLDGIYSETIKLKLTVSDGSVRGDLNKDGDVDENDVVYLVWNLLFQALFPLNGDADFDKDGGVDLDDAAYLLWHTLFAADYPL